ncbi:MAG TPA: topoisomerase C-terminal repeat-containing protein, partial [Acidimicrobiia bacterium]|nr:topoisomerase C-terminal repeat-containing protein [Acidimicrobiia bacterium]
LGPHPETGVPVRVLDGRYGPYVTDGQLNATVPRGVDPASVDLQQAVELLSERAARGPAKKPAKRTAKRKKPPTTTRRTVRKGATRT